MEEQDTARGPGVLACPRGLCLWKHLSWHRPVLVQATVRPPGRLLALATADGELSEGRQQVM